jgi:hypothetical protein
MVPGGFVATDWCAVAEVPVAAEDRLSDWQHMAWTGDGAKQEEAG